MAANCSRVILLQRNNVPRPLVKPVYRHMTKFSMSWHPYTIPTCTEHTHVVMYTLMYTHKQTHLSTHIPS